MTISNYMCDSCQHSIVCKVKDKVDAFHEDAKKQLGVDIAMEECKSFDEVE